jgi:hypothetical protein
MVQIITLSHPMKWLILDCVAHLYSEVFTLVMSWLLCYLELGRPWVDPAWVTPNTMKLVFKGFSKHEVLNSKDWLAGIQIMCLI